VDDRRLEGYLARRSKPFRPSSGAATTAAIAEAPAWGEIYGDKEVASAQTRRSRGSAARRSGHARPSEHPGGADRRESGVNIRQANGIGRVHVAKPQMKETYCGRPVDEEDWITTSKEANCTGCARAGAPRPEEARR
jgi:hypothetical protein